MRRNKKYLLTALLLWVAAEVGHQAYIYRSYCLNGRFYWPYYASERNRPALARLYTLTTRARTQRAFTEVRSGRLVDSVGHMPVEAQTLLLRLAQDIAPSGSLFLLVDPVPTRRDSVSVTTMCPPQIGGCHCLAWLHPVEGGGYVFLLSSDDRERGYTSTELECVRVSNASLQTALQQSPCYEQTPDGAFLNAQGLPASTPLPYNDDHADLMVTKALRATGVL